MMQTADGSSFVGFSVFPAEFREGGGRGALAAPSTEVGLEKKEKTKQK